VLDPSTADPDPIRHVRRWIDEAAAAGIDNADAAALATAGADGRPSVRIVLCRGADERGFVFYTNVESRKARELAVNPEAALAFYWVSLGRQVRAAGSVTPLSGDEVRDYYDRRPLGSRIGAWASPQSRPVASRAELDRLWQATAERFAGTDPPVPPHWGGYRIVPREIELWEHRESRLHDRVLYTRDAAGGWARTRLAP
jgi:pyridoxamine 5'-phosphate oxidase